MMIQEFTTGPPEAVNKLNELVRAVNSLANISGDGTIVVNRTGNGLTIGLAFDQLIPKIPHFGGGGGGTQVRRAKIQSVGTTTLSCKLLDAAGSPSGDAFQVYPAEHLGTNSLSGEVWPKLSGTDNISIFQDINGNWYTTFIFDDTGASC